MIDLSVPGIAALNVRRSDKWEAHDSDVLSSTIAEMDFPIAAPIAEALTAAVERSDLGYAPHNCDRLIAGLAGFAARRLAWTIDPEQVTVVPDVVQGLVVVADALLPPGAPVGFFTPAYPPFFYDLIRPTVSIPLQANYTPDLGALEAALRDGLRVLVLTNPHNPSGQVHTRSQLSAIADLCVQYGAWVLSDEIHAPLVLPGSEFTSWLEVSDAARSCGFVMTSGSKAFNIAGLKCAMVVTADFATRSVMRGVPNAFTDHVGYLGVLATEAAFEAGDEWLDAVVAQLDRNRTLLADGLREHLPEVHWLPPRATYLAWLDCRELGLADPAATFLANGRVAVSSGPAFGPQGDGFVRLNFGTSPELVSEMVVRMARAVGRG